MVNEKMSIETLNQLRSLINKYETQIPKSRKVKASDLNRSNNNVHVETNNAKSILNHIECKQSMVLKNLSNRDELGLKVNNCLLNVILRKQKNRIHLIKQSINIKL